MKSQEKKRCTYCQKEFPKTLEYFSQTYHSQRKNKYLNSRCRDCSRILNKEYRAKNVVKLRENHRKYDKSPKGIYKKLKHSDRSWKVKMTQEEFVEWYKSQQKICCYCGIEDNQLQLVSDRFNNKTYRLTVDRIDSSKDYQMGNIALCCLRCNHIKGDFFTQSEMVEIGKTYISRRWKTNATQH